MAFHALLILVEGRDDARLAESVAAPCLQEDYHEIEILEWASRKPEKIDSLIRNYKSIGYDVLFIGDCDEAECAPRKQRMLLRKFGSIDASDVVISEPEVEAWYLAGAPPAIRRSFAGRWVYSVDGVTKERFNSAMPEDYSSRISLMVEILDDFSVERAKELSDSFAYFVKKSLLQTP